MKTSFIALTVFCYGLAGQTPAFEVASVKPAVQPGMVPVICLIPCAPGERLTVEGNRVDIRYMSLARLIETAYRLKPYQLSGPDWMKTQRFDIVAKLPEGGSRDQVPEMLQSLLVERFKLAFHRENKEQPVYALVIGKNGQKLQPPSPDADSPLPSAPGGRGLYTPGGEASVDANGNVAVKGGPLGPMRGGRGADGGVTMDMLKIDMPGLADLLTPHEDRPVVDKTDLKGAYRFTFEIRRPPDVGDGGRKGGPPADGAGGRDGGGPGADRPPDAFGEALFQALEKAGLKLEKSKAPVATIVVEHLEKTPTEN